MGYNQSGGGPGISEKKFLDNSFFSVWNLSTSRGPPNDLSKLNASFLSSLFRLSIFATKGHAFFALRVLMIFPTRFSTVGVRCHSRLMKSMEGKERALVLSIVKYGREFEASTWVGLEDRACTQCWFYCSLFAAVPTVRRGMVKLTINFSEPTKEELTIFVHSEFSSMVTMDKERKYHASYMTSLT